MHKPSKAVAGSFFFCRFLLFFNLYFSDSTEFSVCFVSLLYGMADDQRIQQPHLSIPDHHLCSLVANLLDNAIEASRKIEDPKIVIEMKMVKDYLSLTIRNKMDPSMQDKALPSARLRRIKSSMGLAVRSSMISSAVTTVVLVFFKRGWYIPSGIHLPPWPLPFLRGSPRQPETVPGAYHLP